MNTLGFDKPPQDTRVVVAMSGGVDSSVTAALLKDEGYDVVGVTLQLYDVGDEMSELAKRGKTCCAGEDIYDAKRVAASLDIPHYVLNYESRFREEVIEEFADAYVRGETPVPCIACNQGVKFRDLLATAKDLGADAMATGHYVKRVMGSHGAQMHKATDPGKDQSYFLFATTREQLDYLRFPLGGMEKAQTRDLAARFNLSVAEKPDSQDICFVPDGDYGALVEKLRPGAADPGDIVHVSGGVLGRHEGIIHYTVGQRKGLGIGGREGGDTDPLYVVRLESEAKRVIVGPLAALEQTTVGVSGVNWLGGDDGPSADGARVTVKLRSTQKEVPATVFADNDRGVNAARVILESPVRGVSPGQACVFYDGTQVLGGGWIGRE